MDGFPVLEVAQFTFVPSAGAVLADWGPTSSRSNTLKPATPSAA